LYNGPFLVISKLGPVNYIIQKTAKSDPKVPHVDKLKPFYGATPKSWIEPLNILMSDRHEDTAAPDADLPETSQAERLTTMESETDMTCGVNWDVDEQTIHAARNPMTDNRSIDRPQGRCIEPAYLNDYVQY
jgi:hypothetical protein